MGETGEAESIKGDASDTFAFSHFFPEPIQTIIAPFCDTVYSTLVALRVCTPFPEDQIDAGNEQASARAGGGLPSLMNPSGSGGSRIGGRREEAERRRALALKALDQRLNAAVAGRGGSAPTEAPAPAVSTDTAIAPPAEGEPPAKAAQA